MVQYETDEEKVEAIKRWVKDNGLSLVLGVVIGLGAILGWRAWQGHQEGQAQQASAIFEQLVATAEAGTSPDAARQLARRLHEDFGKTPYAALGSLVLARIAVDEHDLEGAKQALEQVLAAAPEPALARIAALRLARVLIDQKDLDGAAKIIATQDDHGSFAGELALLRGDIAVAKGELDEARGAYEAALAAGTGQAQLVRIKLANLPSAG